MSPLTLSILMLLAKATLLLALAGVAATLLRKRSAAARHLVWSLATVSVLLLPLFAWSMSDMRIGVPLPSAMTPDAMASVSMPDGAGAVTPLASDPTSSNNGTGLGVAESTAAPAHDASRTPAWRRALTPAGLLLIWATGALAVLAWMAVGHLALHRVKRRASPVTEAAWSEAQRDAAWLLDVRRPVSVYRSSAASMPVTWGVLRPFVLLPAESDSWSAERRRVVLLHELSHVARWDCLTQLLAGVACAVYWFHPGAWYAARRMRVEREHACDDLVLSAGTPAREYAAHLLELAQRYRPAFATPVVALHMARPRQLEGRLLAVLSGASARRPPSRERITEAALGAVLLTLPVSALQPGSTTAAATVPPSAPNLTAALDTVFERDITVRPGQTLALDLRTGGTVEITSWDEDVVRVRSRLAGRDWRASAVDVQHTADGVRVVAWQTDERSSQATSHSFDIRVPRRFNVQLASAGGGITIHNVAGTFRGETPTGNIMLTELTGDADLTTGSGGVRVASSVLSGTVTSRTGSVIMTDVRGGLVAAVEPAASQTGDAPRIVATPDPQASITIDGSDSIARFVRRLPIRAASHTLVTRDGEAMLLLLDRTVVLQLTDHGLDRIGSVSTGTDDDDSGFRALLGGMLRGGLRVLLDRGIEYSLSDLREARYEDGRLVLESRRGNDVFENVSLSNGDVMESFDPRQARAFAARVNAARRALR